MLIVASYTPPLFEAQKYHATLQFRSDISTQKVAKSLRMSQSLVVHLRQKISGEIERQRRGCT